MSSGLLISNVTLDPVAQLTRLDHNQVVKLGILTRRVGFDDEVELGIFLRYVPSRARMSATGDTSPTHTHNAPRRHPQRTHLSTSLMAMRVRSSLTFWISSTFVGGALQSIRR